MNNKAKAYWRSKHFLNLAGLILLSSFLIIIQFTGISARAESFSLSLAGNFYIALCLYLLVISLAYYILSLPLSYYEGFVLERSFSLSNQSFKKWLADDLKRCAVSVPVFLIPVVVFYALARNFQSTWWVLASLFWVGFSIALAKLFPVFVIPLFYKYKPLSDGGALRKMMMSLAGEMGIKVMDVFEIDFSKTTKKSNAALVGWGNTRRVILTDNLINEFTPGEVSVVVAHELAHHKLKHVWALAALSAFLTLLFFFLVSRLAWVSFSGMSIFPSLWLAFIIYGLVTMPLANGYSRKLEKEADILALETTRSKDAFVSLLRKLAEKNLSDENPNKFIEYMLYDHPPISKRIALAGVLSEPQSDE